ncbi:MAG: hypothetical protein IKN71_01470 [Alphaproteobacteria bacterium]|nr:hypothetical protein [Alphaproteobacteria bacterium]
MKKYVASVLLLFFLSAGFSADAQTVEHKQKQPGFFVPEKTLQQAHTSEKLPTAQQMLQQGQRMYTDDHLENSFYPETASASSSVVRQPMSTQGKKSQKMKIKPAPIDEILKKAHLDEASKKEYKKSILASYYLQPSELKQILQKEADAINADTKRMIALKNNWNKQSFAFRLANYKLNDQISTEMAQTSKNYKKRKEKFTQLLKKAPAIKRISIIEATDPLFWHISTQKLNKFTHAYHVKGQQVSQPLHYVSVFDHEYNHAFSYHRKHINPSKNRRIIAARSGNPKIDNIYQPIFDSYLKDLGRISSGLDITNPILLRQIGEMQNKIVTESY